MPLIQDKSRELLKTVALYVCCIFVRCSRRLLTADATYTMLAPAAPGSLGDQAMSEGLRVGLRKEFGPTARAVEIVPVGASVQESKDPQLSPIWYRPWSTRSLLELLLRLARTRALYILGADNMDGSYGEGRPLSKLLLAEQAAKCGIPVGIVSFSFTDRPRHAIIEKFRNLDSRVKFSVRDPESLERFQAATGRQALLGADLAFLMPPAEISDVIERHSECATLARRQPGALLVGVNINILRVQDPGKLFSQYKKAIQAVFFRYVDVQFLFVPHDFRRTQSDLDSLECLFSQLDRDVASRVIRLQEPLSAWDVKGLVSLCDVVVSGRMHLAIAALSQSVPVLSIGYQSKFEGLMELLGIPDTMISQKHALEYGFEAEILYIVEHKDRISQNINQHVANVMNLSSNNVSIVLG